MYWNLRDRSFSRHPYIPLKLHFPPDPLWKYSLGSRVVAPPVSDGGNAFVSSVDAVHSIDLQNGKMNWSVATEQSEYDSQYSHMISSSAISGDYVFFCDDTFNTYCINSHDGSIVWKTNRYWASNESICILNEKLFLRTIHYGRSEYGDEDPGCLMVDPEGNLGWIFSSREKVSTQEMAASKGKIVFGDNAGFIYAVNVEDGSLNWEFDLNSVAALSEIGLKRPIAKGFPTIVGDCVISAVDSGLAYIGINLDDGSFKWLHKTGARTSRSVCDETRLYYVKTGVSSNSFEIIDIQDGGKVFTKEINDPRFYSTGVYDATALVTENAYLCTFYEEGFLVAFEKETGEALWTCKTDGPCVSPPIYIQEKLLFVDYRGTIHCFSC